MSLTDARFGSRVASLQRMLQEQGLEALLITHLPNIRYLSGFTGTIARLLISRTDCFLIVDFRYYAQATQEAPHCTQVQSHGAGFEEATVEAILLSEARRVGFESGHLSFWDHGRLEVCLPKSHKLVPSGGQTEALRLIKDAGEIAALRTAARISRETLADVLTDLRPGMTEAEVAARLEYRFRSRSSEQASFDTLVASGERASLIHARASGHVLAPGEPILIDCGASFQGYKADMSRTVTLGKPDPRFERVHGAVQEALARVIAAVRPGASLRHLDRIARETLGRHGLAETFVHGLGHGVGLEVHEEPWVGPLEEGELAAGMVIALEPGVYLEGWGGVRLEDTVLVTATGSEVLTRPEGAPKIVGMLSWD